VSSTAFGDWLVVVLKTCDSLIVVYEVGDWLVVDLKACDSSIVE